MVTTPGTRFNRPGPGAAVCLGLLLSFACGRSRSSAVQPITVAAPTIASFTPESGAPGTVVVIQGTGFEGLTQVAFGGVVAETFKEQSTGKQISVQVPPGASTGPITVTTPQGGVATSTASFTVLPAPVPVPLPGPKVTSFDPPSVPIGAVVTLTGTGLAGVTEVDFAGTVAPALVIVSDTEIQVTVPANASTGPITGLAPGAPFATSLAFTVTAPPPPTLQPPVLTQFNPPQGIPGTQVTLTGSHLAATTQVSYGGVALGTERFDVDGDTQVRVRIPDTAMANGVLGLSTPAGSVDSASAFALLPSRSQALAQKFETETGLLSGTTLLEFGGAGRTQQYSDLQLPQAPVFHAYDPIGAAPGMRNFPIFTLNFKLPAPFYEAIPASLRAQIATLGVTPAQVDILCVSQNYAYDGVTPKEGVYLFRPHYWTDPQAPNFGIYTATSEVLVGLFEQAPGILFAGHAATELFSDTITVHELVKGVAGPILSSVQQFPMTGFNLGSSTGFWSLAKVNDRVAATLHLFFTDADQAALDGITPTSTDLIQLIRAMRAGMTGGHGLDLLQALVRPILYGGGHRVQVPNSWDDQVILSGSGLTGTRAVTLAGVPVPFLLLSEAALQVTLPRDSQGSHLLVTTAVGVSDPFPAP